LDPHQSSHIQSHGVSPLVFDSFAIFRLNACLPAQWAIARSRLFGNPRIGHSLAYAEGAALAPLIFSNILSGVGVRRYWIVLGADPSFVQSMKTHFPILIILLMTSALPALAQHTPVGSTLVGVNWAKWRSSQGFSVFAEQRTPTLGNRLGVGGYLAHYSQTNVQRSLGLGARLAYHFIDRPKWGAYAGLNAGYGYSTHRRTDVLTDPAVRWGTTIRPLLGVRANLGDRVRLQLETNHLGRLRSRDVGHQVSGLTFGVAIQL